ncbi:hypothetical protein NBH00_18635 [Paraconexibacter antarcticus]|uniref:Peptidase M23 n=1 Tax=Paraconexibacter antarcticus TaxID=2949664 RepID=A0ABY5DQ49_9ACTN|nr:hypothetical protein [Paraconexibacter antarcticus]UTI63358.1 hypothetical protein NBH00_18635 [Paraconexibacter antarcticus]
MRRLGLLVAGVVLPVLLWSLLPVPSTATSTPPSLTAVQRRLQAAEQQLSRRRGREQLLTTQLAGLTSRVRRLQGHVGRLSQREHVVQVELDRKQAALAATQRSLRRQRARRTRLRSRLRVVRRSLAQRLVELYEADRPDLITVVLNSTGFADLLERMDFLSLVADQDRGITIKVRRAHEEAAALAHTLSGLEVRQHTLTNVVLARRDSIARARRRLLLARDTLDGARTAKRDALAGVRVSRDHVQREVSDLRTAQARIQRTLRRAQATNFSAPSALPAGPVRGSGGGPMI